MKRTYILITGMVILSLLAMGCSVCSFVTKKGKDVALTKVIEEVEKQVEKQSTPKPGAADKPKDDTSMSGGDGKLFNGDTVAPSDSLDSYRYEFSMTGRQGDEKMIVSGNGAFVKEPPAAQVYMESQEDDGKTQVMQFIRIGAKVYVYDPDQEGWLAMDSDGSFAAGFNITDMMLEEMVVQFDQEAFKRVDKHDKVNGVDCSHYRADAQDLETGFVKESEITGGTVDMWIANDLGVLIKYEMDVQGKDSDGKPVDAQFTLNIFDANKPVKIEPPPEDQIISGTSEEPEVVPAKTPTTNGVAATLPKPDDVSDLEGAELAAAQALADSGDFDLYQTKLTGDEAVKFFQEAYAGAGWSQDESSSMTTEGLAVLIFTKGDLTVTVIINEMMSPDASTIIVYVE